MRALSLCIWLVACAALAAEKQSAPTETPRPEVAAHSQDPKVAKFAFGTPASVTRAGFVKVTAKDAFMPEKGYGFQPTQGLAGHDRGGSQIARPKDEYTASVYGAYRTTSDLTCALIEGTTDSAFLVALPDGDYTVWLIASDAEWTPPLFEVWANGQKKLDVRIPRARFVFYGKPGACPRHLPSEGNPQLAAIGSSKRPTGNHRCP